METLDVVLADITALRVAVAALLQAMPDRAYLLREFDNGTLGTEAALVNSLASVEFLQLVQQKLGHMRLLLTDSGEPLSP